MNVKALKQTNVILTLFVTTLSGPTSVAVLLDIRVMVESAQVQNCFIFVVGCLQCFRAFKSIAALIFQPSFLAVLHLVVQTQVAWNEMDFPLASVLLVTKVTDIIVQVSLLYTWKVFLCIYT